MSYAAIEDLTLEIGEEQLAKLTGDIEGVEVDEDIANYALSKAEKVIDTFIAGRLELNGDIPEIIKIINTDLAVYYLYERLPEVIIPDTMVHKRRNAISLLEKIKNGQIFMIEADNSSESNPPILSNKNSNDRIFNNL